LSTLWEQAGGEPGVRRVVQALYDALFEDLVVGFLFDGKDKAHIVEQQVRFVSSFLGGPLPYEGKPLPEAHADLPLLAGHFDRRHEMLRRILLGLAMPQAVAAEWLRIDKALKTSVLKSGDAARKKARDP